MIGGGFTGLWTALLARERVPGAATWCSLEAKTVGWAASGRNGGFCSASLTHGIGNGLERFPDEMPLLEKLGEQNLREIGETIAQHGIDCDFQLTGELGVRDRGLAARRARGGGGRGPAARPRRRGARRGGRSARELNSPLLVGGAQVHDGQRAGRARPPRLGAAPRLPGRRGADLRAHPGHLAVAGRGGTGLTLTDPVRLGAGRPGRARRRACSAGRCCAGSAPTWSRSGTTC